MNQNNMSDDKRWEKQSHNFSTIVLMAMITSFSVACKISHLYLSPYATYDNLANDLHAIA